jgi:glycogen debranching enzyme
MDLSPVTAPHTTSDHLHLVAHQGTMTPVLELVPQDGNGAAAEVEITATPSQLSWSGRRGYVLAAFESADTIRIRGEGLGLRIRDGVTPAPFAGAHFFSDPVDGAFVFSSTETGQRYRVTVLYGRATIATRADGSPDGRAGVLMAPDEPWEIAVEELGTARRPYRAEADFASVERGMAAEFRDYAQAIAPWRTDRTPAAELAAYVLWSATVRPAGLFAREAVLMSMHWMDKVWSWDHCFNALALAPGLPQAAYDQYAVVFDHQDTSGALPDLVAHSFASYTYVKPPVHGWAFKRLRALLPPMSREQVVWAHDRLARLTGFWLTHRRVPGHRLPHYQHGNDSGWDNATMFDGLVTAEAPDLAALLVVQLDVLADLAEEIGDDRADHWRACRTDLAAALVDELWNGEDFVARDAADRRPGSARSLLRLIPLVAAHTYAPQITGRLVAAVRAHLTAHGPATEVPDSPDYEADGYWRGPIWAPSTVLIEDSLRGLGETELADEVSETFRRLCEQHGFAENFDALTGQGLRDRSYTWTAGCYLLLARQFVEREKHDTSA